jgi:LDH2 family malate/lactate/ureidoglycolate dehydrogenase
MPYEELLDLVTRAFQDRGLPTHRAGLAAEALCYGDLTGMTSHGTVNLVRLYLPLLDDDRADPAAEPETISDLGAAVLLDAHRALGLWQAATAMDLAATRAARHGIALVSVRNATHFGCAGFHALRAAHRGMIGLVTSNCGRQRLARPPGGTLTMLGTNPLSLAAPAGARPPFLLDMSTTAAPTGRVRAARRLGRQVPAGWLADDDGAPVTDPAAFDRGEAHLLWVGAGPDAREHAEPDTGGRAGSGAARSASTAGYKGYGLGLMVEVLSALVSGSGFGPAREALAGDGTPHGRDDDIGFAFIAIAPELLRSSADVRRDEDTLFSTLLDCPPSDPAYPVRYPGWHEDVAARVNREFGVPLDRRLHAELRDLGRALAAANAAGRRLLERP